MVLKRRQNIDEKFQPVESAASRPIIDDDSRTIPQLSSYPAPFQLSRNQKTIGAPVPPAVNSVIIPQLYANSLPISSSKIIIDPYLDTTGDIYHTDITGFRGVPNMWQQTMPKNVDILHQLEHPYPLFNTPSIVKTYPNFDIEYIYNPTIIGCGSRKQPCDDGSQEIIPNWRTPISVSDENIAPRDVVFPEWNVQPQQVGVLYRITGTMNDELPLFGKRIDEIHWLYYTIINKTAMNVNNIHRGEKLGQNDEVTIDSLPGTFRITQYNDETPLFV